MLNPKVEPAGGFGGVAFLGFLASLFDFRPLAIIFSMFCCIRLRYCSDPCRGRYIFDRKIIKNYFLSLLAGGVVASSFLTSAPATTGSTFCASSFWGEVEAVIKITFQMHSKYIEWRPTLYLIQLYRYDYIRRWPSIWRDIVDAMRTCGETYEVVALMKLRSSYFRKWLIKTGDKFGVMRITELRLLPMSQNLG